MRLKKEPRPGRVNSHRVRLVVILIVAAAARVCRAADVGWTGPWVYAGGSGGPDELFTQSAIKNEGDMALEMASSGVLERHFPSVSSGVLSIELDARLQKATIDIEDSEASVLKVYAADNNDAWAFRWHYPFAWPEVGGNIYPRFYVIDGSGSKRKGLEYTDFAVTSNQWYRVAAVLDFTTRTWEFWVDGVKLDYVARFGREMSWWQSPASLNKVRITSAAFGNNWVDSLEIRHNGNLLAATGFNSDEGYRSVGTVVGGPPFIPPVGPSVDGIPVNVDEGTTTPVGAWKVPPIPDNPSDDLWDQREEGGNALFVDENLGQAYPTETAPELTMTVNVFSTLEGGGIYDVYVRFAGVDIWGPAGTGIAAALGSNPLNVASGESSFLIDTMGSWALYETYVGRATSFDTIVVRLDQYGTERCLPDAVVFQPLASSLADGLVAYWPLDTDGVDIIGGVTCTDTGTGGTSFEPVAMVGSALRTDEHATDSGLRLSPGVTFGLTDRFTLSCWYRIDAVGANGEKTAYHRGHGIGYYNPDNMSTFYYDCRYRDTSDVARFGQITAPHSQSAYEWWHIVQTVSSQGTMQVWAQVSTEADHGGAGASTTMPDYRDLDIAWLETTAVTLGLYEGKGGSTGRIRTDEVAIWNRVLEADEIGTLFDLGKAGTALPVPAPATLGLLVIGVLLRRR